MKAIVHLLHEKVKIVRLQNMLIFFFKYNFSLSCSLLESTPTATFTPPRTAPTCPARWRHGACWPATNLKRTSSNVLHQLTWVRGYKGYNSRASYMAVVCRPASYAQCLGTLYSHCIYPYTWRRLCPSNS